jgi:hypothetical protein
MNRTAPTIRTESAITWKCTVSVRTRLRHVLSRYLEEWLAELNELPQAPITRLVWVSSIWLHRGGVARALGSPALRWPWR